MRKDDVKIGGIYTAKVTNKVVPVRIDAVKGAGWSATNTVTGKKIYIKSVRRLRTAVPAKGAKPTQATTAKDATQAPTLATGANRAAKAGKDANPQRAATRAKQGEPKAKRPSGLDAAARVLAESGKPMTCRQIVEAAFQQKYWTSDGLTPYATIYSAMIREIAQKGTTARFKKIGRGRFVARPAAKG
ncbi:MAG: winged helix-turn-helix domain-containing protein [Phycisphaerae bacterium]|nr:winged helix-turn-helix domain-containing protein [Phycisphaerae bacterium]